MQEHSPSLIGSITTAPFFQDPQMRALIIPFPIAAELESHARRELPNECCGMLGGRSSRIEVQYPLRNLSTSPLTKYFASPEDLFRAMRQMRESGQELLAIYHSHPRGRPYPSPTDIKLAFYPGVVHIIVGFTPKMEMCGYTIRERMPEPAEIVIEHE